jgi:site-specific DNA-methyltransferase (adenine-specific)
MDINISKRSTFYKNEDFLLIEGNSFYQLKKIVPKSIDLIFADPPYFLSNGGITVKSGKMVSVNKASWDTNMPIEKKLSYYRKWIKLCRNILKDDGSLWISGTMHNIYYVGVALELEGFNIINNVIWKKLNPPPNIAIRSFTHSTETILWARKQLTPNKKGKHTFNYWDMKALNGGKQMKDVWEFPLTRKSEKHFGKHPTQKPLELLERIILASSKEQDVILDPFNGSGTTGIAAAKLNRKYIGIDNVKEYLEITKKRYLSHREKSDD